MLLNWGMPYVVVERDSSYWLTWCEFHSSKRFDKSFTSRLKQRHTTFCLRKKLTLLKKNEVQISGKLGSKLPGRRNFESYAWRNIDYQFDAEVTEWRHMSKLAARGKFLLKDCCLSFPFERLYQLISTNNYNLDNIATFNLTAVCFNSRDFLSKYHQYLLKVWITCKQCFLVEWKKYWNVKESQQTGHFEFYRLNLDIPAKGQ